MRASPKKSAKRKPKRKRMRKRRQKLWRQNLRQQQMDNDSNQKNWVAQATGLCRWATRPTEWEKTFFLKQTFLFLLTISAIPVGGSPTGTGRLPVPPIGKTHRELV